MQSTLVNLVIEWARAPAAFRMEFDHAKVISGGINVGWGTHDAVNHSFTFTSTDEICRVCFGLQAEGPEPTRLPGIIRAVDTAHPFEVKIADVLNDGKSELMLSGPAVKIYAEVDWFAML